jgi:hypothetical protein
MPALATQLRSRSGVSPVTGAPLMSISSPAALRACSLRWCSATSCQLSLKTGAPEAPGAVSVF